ncbi:polysaccharide lyase family 1 protein [Pedobacter sp. SYSU D00535]|uniref:pectate lyase family protein n=1 Tax=Pedobacter sp. SYSU D00535 TaxID=2810308 RepID=UPI001A959461|nr:hypothetical protein [Pedobacter sp. SYSU D00535]
MKRRKSISLHALVILLSIVFFSCSKSEQVAEADEASISSKLASGSVSAFTVATADGFATGTTGGAGGTSTTVSTAAAFKSAAESSTAQIITVSGNIDLGSTSVLINSNKTIIGATATAGIKGNLRVSGKTNVIIQNLNITNPSGVGTGDGLEISGSTKVFVTKCTFTDCADGMLDVVRASDNVTVSWCRFRYVSQTSHKFCNLIGNSDSATGDRGKLRVTMHHNWYDVGVVERQPRVRFGKVHCYNNFYGSNSDNYTVGVGYEADIFLESNYFENQGRPWADYSNGSTYRIKWNSGNTFVNSPVPTWAPNSSTTFSIPYSYTLDAGSNVKTIVTGGAGNK